MSVRGKLFHIMLRYRHLLKGQLKRDVIDENTSIEKLRHETDEAAARLMKKIEGVTYRQADYRDLYAEWVEVENAP